MNITVMEDHSIDGKFSELYQTLTVWEAVAKPGLVNFIFANIPSFITWPNLHQPSCPCQLSSVNIWNEIIFPLLKNLLPQHYQHIIAREWMRTKSTTEMKYDFFYLCIFLHVCLDLTLGGLKNCLIIIWGLFINIV